MEENKAKQPRIKSWALWTAIAALLAFCLKEFGGIDIYEKVYGFMNVLLPVVIAFGVVNDPTSHNSL